ncbi:hypothetical protein L3X38_022776 [Prunus dulcis]|uniref:Translation elongation factor EFTu-like domain-containing protein n=1 Tax=Prunus dulcis TaxID=3755 RepID=A0AAD4Z3V9_PRUDU|nr:hypothetical protein L3X38_022776 [Prunus dulcis]
MLTKLGVTMKSDEKELMGKALMKRVMQTWLPASSALLEMMIFHLPSPSTAQRYRVENLVDSLPLGRVFAGKVQTGLKVRIMGPKYVPGEKKDLYVKNVQRTVIWMERNKKLLRMFLVVTLLPWSVLISLSPRMLR